MLKEIRHDQLIEVLRLRYDFYSARAVLERSIAEAGLPEKVSYTPAEVRLIAGQLAVRTNERVDEVVTRMRLQADLTERSQEQKGAKGPAPREPARAAAPDRRE